MTTSERQTQPTAGGPGYRVFVDFDGTTCQEDTGVIIIDSAGPQKRIDLEREVLSGKKPYRVAVDEMWKNVTMPIEKATEQLSHAALDIGTPKLREFLKRKHLPLYILSNGLDVLIEPILSRATKVDVRNNCCVGDIYLIANHGHPKSDGWQVTWKHPNSEHGHDKAATIEGFLEAGETVVFVGDGISDIASVNSLIQKSQPLVVFAKAGLPLEKFCIKNKIEHISFKTLNDVVSHLDSADFSSKRKAPADSAQPSKKQKLESSAQRLAENPISPAKYVQSEKKDLAPNSFVLVYDKDEQVYLKYKVLQVQEKTATLKDVDDEAAETKKVQLTECKPLLSQTTSAGLSVGQKVLAVWPETTAAYPVEIKALDQASAKVCSLEESDDELVTVAFFDICATK